MKGRSRESGLVRDMLSCASNPGGCLFQPGVTTQEAVTLASSPVRSTHGSEHGAVRSTHGSRHLAKVREQRVHPWVPTRRMAGIDPRTGGHQSTCPRLRMTCPRLLTQWYLVSNGELVLSCTYGVFSVSSPTFACPSLLVGGCGTCFVRFCR